ncbi:MAG: CoA-binding protein [Dehalococcoidia bacterium]|nr:CoA-binding protein [Dehalococcoidia bacterium]
MPDLDFMFHPKSIAVVGASPRPLAPSNVHFFYPLLMYGYPGKLYPVHPSADKVHGLKAYRSILEIPEPVDYVVSAIPARQVPQLIRDCVTAKVKAVTVFTSGFSEIGTDEGARLEREIVGIARQGGVRLVGPNCLGLHCPKAGLSLDGGIPKSSGGVGFLAQSGGNARELVVSAAERAIFISKGVSFGNAADLNESDFLEYLTADVDTKIIAVYIEGAKEPTRFARALGEAARSKPVVVLKGGVTKAGVGVVASHTGALAGSRQVWETLCRQTGAIQVHHFDELIDTLAAFVYLKAPRGRRVGVIGVGGGASVLAADECENAGLEVPALPEQIRRQLLEYTPPVGVGLRNPLDLDTDGFMNPELAARTVRIMAQWEGIDLLILSILPGILLAHAHFKVLGKHVEAVAKVAAEMQKPLLVVLRTGGVAKSEEAAQAMQADCQKAGFAVFRSVDAAARAVVRLTAYHGRWG